MFLQRRDQNMLQAAGTILVLIHGQTVYRLRNTDRNAFVGLVFSILQSVMLLFGFIAFYLILGMRTAPIRGDFILFLMSGIFLFMTHVATVGAVSKSFSISGLAQHVPLNAAIMISAAALSTLYTQTISALVILGVYHTLVTPVYIDNISGCIAMYLLSWFSGICIGIFFLAISPWHPKFAQIFATAYQRINMISSGKMFAANSIPTALLPFFYWCPLFHIIDRMRGFVFLNYTPKPDKTNIYYPIWFSIAALVIGLLINFTTRKYESVSWKAAQ